MVTKGFMKKYGTDEKYTPMRGMEEELEKMIW